MAGGGGRLRKIRHMARLRQMIGKWKTRAAPDVPAGHVAVCVGRSGRRFVVRAAHLNHPAFQKLLMQAEEERGFVHAGPISVPCDESVFEDTLRRIERRRASQPESLPLLRGIAETSSC